MKKATIWTVAIVMGLSFLVLLFMQIKYIEEMVHMKKEQFDESVTKALYQAARNLELNETLRYLEKDVNETDAALLNRILLEPGLVMLTAPFSIRISIRLQIEMVRCIRHLS